MRIFTGLVTFATLMSLATLASAAGKSEKKHKDEWQPIFDGKTLDGWKASDHPESWSIKDGVIHGDGPGSYLFYMNAHCFNCEFKADVQIGHEGNSGMFFRSPFSKSPADYEAQIDSSHRDPVRTGSLYHFVKILEVLVPDDTWFTQRIVVEGNHIQVFVNDKQTVDFIDEKNTKTDGLFALQQHNAGSIVEFKNVMWKVLPPPKSPLVGTWKLNLGQSKYSAGDARSSRKFGSWKSATGSATNPPTLCRTVRSAASIILDGWMATTTSPQDRLTTITSRSRKSIATRFMRR